MNAPLDTSVFIKTLKHFFYRGTPIYNTPPPPPELIYFCALRHEIFFERLLLRGKGNTIFVEFGLVDRVLLLKTIQHLAQML